MSSMEDGSGDGEERASGKEDRVEQGLLLGRELVVELVMRGGEDLSRVEEGREVVTGEDLLPGEVIRVGRAVRVVVVVGRDSSRGTLGQGKQDLTKRKVLSNNQFSFFSKTSA